MVYDTQRLNSSGVIHTHGAHHPLKLDPREAHVRPDLHAYAPHAVFLPPDAPQVGHSAPAGAAVAADSSDGAKDATAPLAVNTATEDEIAAQRADQLHAVDLHGGLVSDLVAIQVWTAPSHADTPIPARYWSSVPRSMGAGERLKRSPASGSAKSSKALFADLDLGSSDDGEEAGSDVVRAGDFGTADAEMGSGARLERRPSAAARQSRASAQELAASFGRRASADVRAQPGLLPAQTEGLAEGGAAPARAPGSAAVPTLDLRVSTAPVYDAAAADAGSELLGRAQGLFALAVSGQRAAASGAAEGESMAEAARQIYAGASPAELIARGDATAPARQTPGSRTNAPKS